MPKPRIRSDQADNLTKITTGKTVTVFIDAANLYYAGSKVGIRISFEALADWFTKHAKKVQLNFYTAFDPEGKEQIEFLDNLVTIGYNVIKKPIKVFSTMTKGNMDIELAVDALSQFQDYEVMVLMSGDGDFSYLLQYLQSQKKVTVAVGVGGYSSHELNDMADHYFFLDRLGKVWQNKLKYNQQNYKIFLDTIQDNDYNKPEETIPLTTPLNLPTKKLETLKLRIQKPSISEPKKDL